MNCLVVDGCLVFAYLIERVFGDVPESSKETLYMETISQDFSGYLIDFRGFRKYYFLGFSLNLNGYSLFVNYFISLLMYWVEPPGWHQGKECLTCHCKVGHYNTIPINSRSAFFCSLFSLFIRLQSGMEWALLYPHRPVARQGIEVEVGIKTLYDRQIRVYLH